MSAQRRKYFMYSFILSVNHPRDFMPALKLDWRVGAVEVFKARLLSKGKSYENVVIILSAVT